MDELNDFNPDEEINLCSRCQRWGMTFLRSMGRRSTVDWFACTVCGHLTTRPRQTERDVAGVAVGKPLGSC
jgi:hypothetical protein